MSPVAAGLDGLLALLLVAALGLGARLNARLKALRDGQAGFAAAVVELNQAAARAEAGLNALKAAQEESHDQLLARIETARALAARLERAGTGAEARLAPRASERVQPRAWAARDAFDEALFEPERPRREEAAAAFDLGPWRPAPGARACVAIPPAARPAVRAA